MKALRDENGQVMVFTLLCMTCLLGFVAFATDVGTLLYAKRTIQSAADSAAVAGATELKFTAIDQTTVRAVAQAAAAQNGFTNGANGATVSVNNPPSFGPHAGNSAYVEVVVQQSEPTVFMKIFKFSAMTVSARAVAALGVGEGCIFTLGATGADINVVGNASISVPKCGIVDDSSSGNGVNLVGNVTVTAQSIGVVGGVSKTGNVSVNPTPITGIAPDSDPLSYLQAPTVSNCSPDPMLAGNKTVTLSPGCYNGITASGNVNLTLNPGTYVINGNLNLGGNISLTGTGVTLDLLGSTSLPGNLSLNLTAPTSGAYSGIVIYQPASNTNTINLTGNSGSTLKGVIYAPGAAVDLTGNSGSTIYTDFVAKSLTLTGNATFQSYAASPGSASPLTSARLVE